VTDSEGLAVMLAVSGNKKHQVDRSYPIDFPEMAGFSGLLEDMGEQSDLLMHGHMISSAMSSLRLDEESARQFPAGT
jgi:hypothetical protein